jgi:hypothetical protein
MEQALTPQRQAAFDAEMAEYKQYADEARAMILARCAGDIESLPEFIDLLFEHNTCFPFFIELVRQNPEMAISDLLCTPFAALPLAKYDNDWGWLQLTTEIDGYRIVTNSQNANAEPYYEPHNEINSWGALMGNALDWLVDMDMSATSTIPKLSWLRLNGKTRITIELGTPDVVLFNAAGNRLCERLAA